MFASARILDMQIRYQGESFRRPSPLSMADIDREAMRGRDEIEAGGSAFGDRGRRCPSGLAPACGLSTQGNLLSRR